MRSSSLLRLWAGPSLAFGVLLLEIPVIYGLAGGARHGQASIAALGAAIGVLVLVQSPSLAVAATTTAFLRGDRSWARLRRFSVAIGVACGAVLLALGLTGAGGALIGAALSLPADTVALVQSALVLLAPASPAVALRRVLQGAFIRSGDTRSIALAAGLRLGVSSGTALLLRAATGLAGFELGAIALATGAWSEMVALELLAHRRVRITPSLADVAPPTGELLRFHAAVTAKTLMDNLYLALITATIGRLPGEEVALVAWPILYGVVSVCESGTRELETITISVLRGAPVTGSAARFSLWVGLVLSAIWATAIWVVPLLREALTLFGLRGDALALALDAAAWVTPLFAIAAVRGYLRGVLLARGRAALVGFASHVGAAVIVAVAIVGGGAGLFENGVVAAACALVTGVAADTALCAFTRPA